MMPFDVVGTGPGHPDYLIPLAKTILSQAQCLVASPRLLKMFGQEEQEQLEYHGNLHEVLDFIDARRQSGGLVVAVSGDPGFHSLLGAISKRFHKHEYRVIPGLSSVQVAAAASGEPWQGDLLVSSHGMAFDEKAVLGALQNHQRVIFLTDQKRTPFVLARWLEEKGFGEREAWAGAHLTWNEEQVLQCRVNELSKMDEGKGALWVLMVR